MTKLDIAKKIIKEHYNEADCGLYNTRNFIGDPMTTLYEDKDGLFWVDICYSYFYFEVFGLTDDEFKELSDFYDSLSDN